jgi:homoserine kinase
MLRVRVPASTTNLGHGFDCLGIALGLWNEIAVREGPGGVVAAEGPHADGLAAMADKVRAACLTAWGKPLPGLHVAVQGEIPVARGMGSSSTIAVGVAAACRRLAGLPADPLALVEVATAVEGHPDNAAAAALGGFTVVGAVGKKLRCARFAVPAELRAVIAIPPFEVATPKARAILPKELSRADAVLGLQRTALITAALAAGRIDDLRSLFDDAWHERYRAELNPGLSEARKAAAAAGAIGTILSGSGSTVLSFARAAEAEAVRAAVERSYRARQVEAEVRVIGFAERGAEER